MSDMNANTETGNCNNQRATDCLCGGRGPMASHMMQSMMPRQAGEHFRNAGVEFLKGFRELLDLQIEALSPKETKGTKLNVE